MIIKIEIFFDLDLGVSVSVRRAVVLCTFSKFSNSPVPHAAVTGLVYYIYVQNDGVRLCIYVREEVKNLQLSNYAVPCVCAYVSEKTEVSRHSSVCIRLQLEKMAPASDRFIYLFMLLF